MVGITYDLTCDRCGATTSRKASTVSESGWVAYLAADSYDTAADYFRAAAANCDAWCLCPTCAEAYGEYASAVAEASAAIVAWVGGSEASAATADEGAE